MLETKWAAWITAISAACILAGCGGEDHPAATTQQSALSGAAHAVPFDANRQLMLATRLETHEQGEASARAMQETDADAAAHTEAQAPVANGADIGMEDDAAPEDGAINAASDHQLGLDSSLADDVSIDIEPDASGTATTALENPAITNAREAFKASWSQRARAREMKGFSAREDLGLSSAALKFIIGSIGQQKLEAHLTEFITINQKPDLTAAAQSFLAMVAGNADSNSNAKKTKKRPSKPADSDFMDELMKLPAFTGLVLRDTPQALPKFLEMLTKAFQLGEIAKKSGSKMCHTVNLDALASDAVTLQSVVASILPAAKNNADATADTSPPMLDIANIENFHQLAILVTGNRDPHDFDFDAAVELPVRDVKSHAAMRLRMQATEMIFRKGDAYYVLMKQGHKKWRKHSQAAVTTADSDDFTGRLMMVNLSVSDAQAEQ